MFSMVTADLLKTVPERFFPMFCHERHGPYADWKQPRPNRFRHALMT